MPEIIGTLKKAITLLLIILVTPAPLVLMGCQTRATFIPVPYLPPMYYDCIQVDPQALVSTYFVGNVDIVSVRAKYDGAVFVFKEVRVNDRMFTGMNEGFIWVDQIKCYLTNPENIRAVKTGDKIDVVGRNAGQTSLFIPGLTFRDCLILPAGQRALPVVAGPVRTFGPAY